MKRFPLVHVLAAALVAAGCGGGSSSKDATTDTVAELPDVVDAAEVGPADATDETPADSMQEATDVPQEASDDVQPDAEDATDAEEVKELPELKIQPPLPTPDDPLKDSGVESCSIYLEEKCEGGVRKACHVYDTKDKSFVADPDPMLRRVLLLERWRDLYSRPDGMTSEPNFNTATLPGTPEAEWADPARFVSHGGMGDSGIWTGWTVIGDILRYSQTGTEADYRRMENGIRTLVNMYEVSGVPGYLVRYFFLKMPDGAPNSRDHVFRYDGQFTNNHHIRPVDPAALDRLPAVYRDGITDGEGTVWKGTPLWQGRPSIDQNTGPMNAFPMEIGRASCRERV